jgi:hypothetical protein
MKTTILRSGARDAVVSWTATENINPYYLRCAPFLLFSDPDILERKLLFITGWHFQPRHNTHIPEADFASARPRLIVDFLPANGVILAHISEVNKHFAVKVRFGVRIPRAGAGEPILTTGKSGDANFLFVTSTSPGTVTFNLDAWGTAAVVSAPVAIDPKREYRLDIDLGAAGIKLRLDGTTVWERSTPVRSLDNPQYGLNSLGGSTTSARFSGTAVPLDVNK